MFFCISTTSFSCSLFYLLFIGCSLERKPDFNTAGSSLSPSWHARKQEIIGKLKLTTTALCSVSHVFRLPLLGPFIRLPLAEDGFSMTIELFWREKLSVYMRIAKNCTRESHIIRFDCCLYIYVHNLHCSVNCTLD